jgi:hypothetical protein
MFLAKGLGRMGRMGDFVNRSPDYKIDNWIGQVPGGAMAPVAPSVIPGVSNTTAAAVGIGGLAAAAALAYYLMK